MEFDKSLLKTRKNLDEFNHVLKKLSDNKVALLLSPDESAFNAPGYALVEEMKLYKKAGLSNYDILQIATINAATFFGEQNEWGSIAKGKKANLVLLDKNPLDNIEHVKAVAATILCGRIYKPAVLLKK
jgi:imidazolonepropionase-like amidohydrolase